MTNNDQHDYDSPERMDLQEKFAKAVELITAAEAKGKVPRGSWAVDVDAEKVAVDWELKYQELSVVHEVFCTAIRKAVGMECPMPLSDILDNVIALAESHRREYANNLKESKNEP